MNETTFGWAAEPTFAQTPNRIDSVDHRLSGISFHTHSLGETPLAQAIRRHGFNPNTEAGIVADRVEEDGRSDEAHEIRRMGLNRRLTAKEFVRLAAVCVDLVHAEG